MQNWIYKIIVKCNPLKLISVLPQAIFRINKSQYSQLTSPNKKHSLLIQDRGYLVKKNLL